LRRRVQKQLQHARAQASDSLVHALMQAVLPLHSARHSCAAMPQPQSSPEQLFDAEAEDIERETKTNNIATK